MNTKCNSVEVLKLLKLTCSTTSTGSTTSTTSTILSKREIVLLALVEPKSISEVYKETGFHLSTISQIIHYSARNSGLIVEALVEPCGTNTVGGQIYKATEEGIQHLVNIAEGMKRQKEFEDLQYQQVADTSKNIELFRDFFEKNYTTKLSDVLSKGQNFLYVPFIDISRFEPSLADHVLDEPEEAFKEMEIAIKDFEEVPGHIKRFHIRLINLPDSSKQDIAAIRTKHLGKLVKVTGAVVCCSDVRPQVTTASFECPSCGNIMSVIQLEAKFKEPTRCGCGRKGKFRLLKKDLVDAQKLVIEELSENLDSRTHPVRLDIFLKDDLTDIDKQPQFESSVPVIVNGIPKEVPVPTKEGGKLVTFDLMIDVNSIEFDESLRSIKITPDDLDRIRDFAKANPVQNLIKDFAPEAFNRDAEKEALLLSAVSGGGRGLTYRDDSHLLFVGDPSTMKSTLMIALMELIPGSRWASGMGTSAPGLQGTVSRDDFFKKGWMLEKGVMPLANQNVCFIDELEQLKDKDALHEPMENQCVFINKASVHQRLQTDCTVIAAMNPKMGHFDSVAHYPLQEIDMISSLMDRWDIIVPFFDTITNDEAFAKQIQSNYSAAHKNCSIDSEFVRKYLYYVRNNFSPKPDAASEELIRCYWVELRRVAKANENRGIRISPRQLQALERLTRARAKLRCSDVATVDDAKAVIKLKNLFFQNVGLVVDLNNVGGVKWG